MKKKTSIILDIPKPCHEDWDKMTPNEQGRHCDSCNKTVIDFSLFSDRQLIEYFSKVRGNICGRLSDWQMNRELVYVEPQNSFLHKLLFGTAMTLGLAGSANGNYNPNQAPIVQQNAHQAKATQPGKKKPHYAPTHYIKGTTLDAKTGQAVPYISIAFIYKGKIIGEVKSDSNGNYKFRLNGIYRGKEITIERTYVQGAYDNFSETIILNTLPYTFDMYLQVVKRVEVVAYATPMLLPTTTRSYSYTSSNGGMVCIRIDRKYEPSTIDINHPDQTTIHRGDTPYW